MKRNMIEELKRWGDGSPCPFYLYGIRGVGKTYLVNEYVSGFKFSFVYFKTEPGSDYYSDFKTMDSPEKFVSNHYGFSSDELTSAIVVFDDSHEYISAAVKLISYAIMHKCRWIFISDYDYLKKSTSGIEIRELFPMQFDEFLAAMGSEWYVEAIRGHFESRKKLPDIVHEELLSDFEEYIWVGGMPEVVNDYLTKKTSVNITSLQRNNKRNALDISEISEEQKTKSLQILNCIQEQLFKENRKFMFNVIRTGVTLSMYNDAINELESKRYILRQNEYTSEKKFKLFYPEFSFITGSRHDELTEVEYKTRIINYVLQTLNQKKIETVFWESGNRAELDFIIKEQFTQFPIDFGFSDKNNSKSIISFSQKYDCKNIYRISESNYSKESGKDAIPIYALFCFSF